MWDLNDLHNPEKGIETRLKSLSVPKAVQEMMILADF